MATRYRLIVSYDGAPFAGWQRQPNAPTVQETLETALAAVLGESVTTIGASRTDTGVHARGQALHLDLQRPFPLRGLIHGTNHQLPPSIRVLAAHQVPPAFHARRSAAAKEYRYRLIRARVLSPLDAPYALGVDENLNAAAMRDGAQRLLGEHDFGAFAKSGGSHGHSRRTIFGAGFDECGPELELWVRGNGFLRGMVRAIVGTLLEVGRGRRSPVDLEALLRGGSRGEAGPTAPAHALVLTRVFYGERWRALRAEGIELEEVDGPGGVRWL